MSNPPPTAFGERYLTRERLGTGAVATVYRAWDRALERDVAVKALHPHLALDSDFVRRFAREATTAAQLVHPHIACVFDVGRDDATHFIVMEYVDGGTLRERLNECGPLDASTAVAIARSLCAALAAAHARGILHRDCKPANVLLARDGTPKLADFGLARVGRPGDRNGHAEITLAGDATGTAAYWSPEQARGETPSAASDLYALGVVLFAMLAGRLPFLQTSPLALALAHERETPPDLASLGIVDARLWTIVARLLRKDPAERYASAGDLARALDAYEARAPIPDDPTVVVPATASPQPAPTAVRARPPSVASSALSIPLGPSIAMAVALATAVGVARLANADFVAGSSRASASVARNDRTSARVSLAATTTRVPNVLGLGFAQARATLVRAHLRSTAYARTASDAGGAIVAENPPPGSTLRVGTHVVLVLSRRPSAATATVDGGD